MTAPLRAGRPVELPWRVLPGFQCFGCSPTNVRGLQLRFTRTDTGIECALSFDRTYESYPGVVHGGMSTTACDEAMGNLLVLRTGFSVFTTSLRTRYISPLRVGAAYRCAATTQVSAGDKGPYQAHAQIIDADGNAIVFATGGYRPVTPDHGRSFMDLSDHEAELIEHALSPLRTTD
jgi:acyl-coenzyme A thioesterase PaaI-like protein